MRSARSGTPRVGGACGAECGRVRRGLRFVRPRGGVHLPPRRDSAIRRRNKRAALASGLVFLDQNGIALEDPDERLYDAMIGVATKAIGKAGDRDHAEFDRASFGLTSRHYTRSRRYTRLTSVGSSVPLVPREPWWTKIAKAPTRLWSMSREMASLITDGSHRQPSKRKLALIRVGVTASLVLLLPFGCLWGSRYRRATAFDALHARVREIGQTSTAEAIGLLRSIFKQLCRSRRVRQDESGPVSPFGIFRTVDTLSIHWIPL